MEDVQSVELAVKAVFHKEFYSDQLTFSFSLNIKIFFKKEKGC